VPHVETVTIDLASASQRDTLFVPKSWFNSYQLREGQLTSWRFGSHVASPSISIFPSSSAKSVLYAPDSLLSAWMLTPNTTVNVKIDPKRSLFEVGPLIGILAHVRNKSGDLTGKQEPVFRRLLAAAKRYNAVAYVFSPTDVEWAKGRCKGYWLGTHPISNQKWEERYFPLPDVIYDQIVSRSFDKRDDVQQTKSRFYKLLAPRYFNQGFFDKWQTFEWLKSDRRSVPYVPETAKYGKVSDMLPLLSKFQTVYLKPIHGTHGVGIIKVSKGNTGDVTHQLKRRNGKVIEGVSKTVHQALSRYSNRLRGSRYIVQRGLRLLSYHGRPFDIRVLLQRDLAGVWKRAKIFARVAPEGDFASNLTTGGEALAARHVLSAATKDEKAVKRIMHMVHQIIKTIPVVIEEQSDQTLGEMGVDLGVDDHFHVWIIEVNAKPWKSPTTEHGSEAVVVRSFERPIEYAIHLAGFGR